MRVRRPLVLLAGLALTATLPVIGQAAEPRPDARCVVVDTAAAVSAECQATGVQYDVGTTTFEPTLGAAPDGSVYYSTTIGSGVAVGFGAGTSRSTDGARTWKDVSPVIAGRRVPVETNDPYVYVDPGTGRAFSFHMSPILTCSTLSYSDDGGASWFTNPLGCGPTGVWDHQTMVASKPRVLQTQGYPNVLVQCVNAVYAEMCSRSLDGGRTWSPSTPAYQNNAVARGALAGTQTGHLRALKDGTILLPTSEGGDKPYVWVSRDDSLTWTRSLIADMRMPFDDPTVGGDPSGNAYAAWTDAAGAVWYATSRDGARTWGKAVKVTPPGVAGVKPALTVGDDGKVAIAFFGTDDHGFPVTSEVAQRASWGGWIASTTNGLAASPVFQVVEASGRDPLVRGAACVPGGRCTYQVDFIDVTVTPDGTPLAAFVDGCTADCATGARTTNNEPGNRGRAVALTVEGLDLCSARCGHFGPATAGAAAEVPTGGPVLQHLPAPSAQQAPLDDAVARARAAGAAGRPDGYGLVG